MCLKHDPSSLFVKLMHNEKSLLHVFVVGLLHKPMCPS